MLRTFGTGTFDCNRSNGFETWLGRGGQRPANGDRQTVATQTVGAIEDDRPFYEIQDRGQFHASRSMDAKIDSNTLSAPNHLALRHGKLVGNQLAEITQSMLNCAAKCRKIHVGGRHTDHKRPLGRSELRIEYSDRKAFDVRQRGYRRRPRFRLVFKKRLLVAAAT